jgi:hypothetical protein
MDWKPTLELRLARVPFAKDAPRPYLYSMLEYVHYVPDHYEVLQQKWVSHLGTVEWRDVPKVDI